MSRDRPLEGCWLVGAGEGGGASAVGEMHRNSSKGKFRSTSSLRKTCLHFPKYFRLPELKHLLRS